MKSARLPAFLLLIGLLLSGCAGDLWGTPLPSYPGISNPRSTKAPASGGALTPAPADTTAPLSTPTLAETETPAATFTPSPTPCNPALGFCLQPGHFLLDRPIAAPGTITVDPTYTYGTTQGGAREPHHGVEFYNGSGTPVLAAADGTVVVAGNDSQTAYGPALNLYGNLIVIEHHFPGIQPVVFTLYGHLSKVGVRLNQAVRAGELIGEVGSTGAAIGSHLHFEVRLGQDNYDSNRNPVLWLKPLAASSGQSFGVIAGRLTDGQGNLIHTQNLNIQYFPDPNGPQAAVYQVETYAPEEHPVQPDDQLKENFTLGDLPAGQYRISLVWSGALYETRVEVRPGQVTWVVLQAGQ